MTIKSIPGPDPDTRTPAFKLPPLACDAHCHIFGPGDRYPYAPDRSYTPLDAPLEMFRALHAKIGVERAVIVNASVHGTDNRVALDAIAVSGGRYRAVANIDDTITDAELEVLHQGGFRGCRFNFVRHLGGVPDLKVFDRVVARIAPLGWHVDLHFDAIDLPEFAPMLNRLPVRYTIDHMGLLFYIREELLIVLATTSSESVLPRMLVKLEALGCEESVVGLVVPTGYSFNLDGTCLYLASAAIFLAQATNTPLDIWQQLGLLGVLLLTSKGAAGVAGAAFVVLAATLASVGTIPVASVALILGIHRLMSEGLTPTNLIGNAVATIVIAKWEGGVHPGSLRIFTVRRGLLG